MLTNRRSSEASGAWPVISRRQEKAAMLSFGDEVERVGDGGHRRLHVLERRLLQAQALDRLRDRAEDAAQRRIGGQGSEERLSLDQLRHVALHVVDAAEQNAVAGEELAAVGPGHGADHVRLGRERVGQRRGRLFRALGRRRVDDRDDPIGPLGEEVVKLDLLLAPGERARQELAAVGVDGDVARKIEAGEDRRDEEARNDEPRVAGR